LTRRRPLRVAKSGSGALNFVLVTDGCRSARTLLLAADIKAFNWARGLQNALRLCTSRSS
jgi:hypothetical protein